jgi:hypothetical protein
VLRRAFEAEHAKLGELARPFCWSEVAPRAGRWRASAHVDREIYKGIGVRKEIIRRSLGLDERKRI